MASARPVAQSGDTKRVAEWFGIPESDAQDWLIGNKTLENVLNLSPSEDATITHFIVPFLRRALGYSVKDIDIKPHLTRNAGRAVKQMGGQSDVVVRKHDDPVFVIEAKSYGHALKSATEDAEGQAYDYSQANELKPKPRFYLDTNVVETHIYETNSRKELPFSPVMENELVSKFVEMQKWLSKKRIVALGRRLSYAPVVRAPVSDDKEFGHLLLNCQNEMRNASKSKTGKDAFTEMNKLLFIKLYEDRREREGKENRFTLQKVEAEGENYIGGTLFEDLKTHYRLKNVPIFRSEDKLELDDVIVNGIVETLQKKFLVDEEGKVYPPVAHVYENFVSTIFRGENGQYFTPRRIVDFMVDMVGPSWGSEGLRCVDPACGSGGFLLSVFTILDNELRQRFMEKTAEGNWLPFNEASGEEYDRVKKSLCEEMLVGFDNEDTIAKTAAMNLSVHGDGSTGIHYGDSLRRIAFENELKEGSFKLALTNPPFSSNADLGTVYDLDGTDALGGFELAYIHRYDEEKHDFEWTKSEENLRGRDKKILFIERGYQLLEEGGTLGIIVDDGVLDNPTEAYVRDFIKKKFNIKAIVSLPWGAFHEQGAENFTSILLLQKKGTGITQGPEVFMAMAENLGESYGKSTKRLPNDLKDILDDYRKFKSGRSWLSKFSFICKVSDLLNSYDPVTKQVNNRLDPKFYSPRRLAILKAIEETGRARPISEVVDFDREEVTGDANDYGSKFIDRITKGGEIQYEVIGGSSDPKLKKTQIFRKGDLVVSRIQLKNAIVGVVPDDIDEILATDEYYKLVPKKEEGEDVVLRKYLRIVLTSEPFNFLVNATFTGQYGRTAEEELGRLKIPVYDLPTQRAIVGKYDESMARVKSLVEESASTEDQLMTDISTDVFKKPL
ncbi:MAG: N-6 DNA methylase [archaeon]|nr:MAG: N-6 DNA methylase [archaeon]